MRIQLFATSLILFPFMAFSAVYQTVAQDGEAHFSDIATSESQEIFLDETQMNTISLAKQFSNNAITSLDTIPQNYAVIHITQPQDQSSFQNQDPIVINTQIKPDLQQDDQLQLVIDNKDYGQAQKQGSFTINSLERGQHQIQVKLIKMDGTIQLSDKITIYKHQAGILNTLHNAK